MVYTFCSMEQSRLNKFIELGGLLRCPRCKTGLPFDGGLSFACANGHCFDAAKKGYLFLAPSKRHTPYDAALFESRRRVFEAGFYDAVLNELCALLTHRLNTGAPHILDAGCGEGFYALGVYKHFDGRAAVVGIDLEKEAVSIAARGANPIHWLVGDLANLPLLDARFDAVLNIFSPASYGEFLRILKPKGLILKALPGESYLKELRDAAKAQLKDGSYSPGRVTEHFEKHVKVLERAHVKNALPVSQEQLEDFLAMTPMMFGVDVEKLDVTGIKSVTIDVELLVGEKE